MQFADQIKKVRKSTGKMELYFLYIQSNINNVCRYWDFQNVYRLAFHNLQTRKRSEMVQTVQKEISIYSSTTRSQI